MRVNKISHETVLWYNWFMQTNSLLFARSTAFATFPDTTDLARSFLRDTYTDINGDLHLRHWRRRWYRYGDGCYLALDQDGLEVSMRLHVQRTYEQKSQNHHCAMPEVTKTLVANALDALRAEVFIPTEMNHPAWLQGQTPPGEVLHVADRLVELPSASGEGASHAHTPHFFSVNMLPGRFDETLPDPPLFAKFLDETFEGDQERIRFVQEWMGYLLVPDTSRQQMLIMLGEGRNGKSVLLDVISDMLGHRNVSNVPLDNLASRFGLGSTENKLVNICADVGNARRIDEGVLKQFVGGDMMEVEEKYQAPRSFRPTARVMASANTLPSFKDSSFGFWRRILVLPFNRQVPDSQVDRNLTKKLLAERDSILLFAFLGLLRLRSTGDFTSSRKMAEAVKKYQKQSSPVQEFLSQCYAEGSGAVLKDSIYQEYVRWNASQGNTAALNQSQLGIEVKRAFPNVADGREPVAPRRYSYEGLLKKAPALGEPTLGSRGLEQTLEVA